MRGIWEGGKGEREKGRGQERGGEGGRKRDERD